MQVAAEEQEIVKVTGDAFLLSEEPAPHQRQDPKQPTWDLQGVSLAPLLKPSPASPSPGLRTPVPPSRTQCTV